MRVECNSELVCTPRLRKLAQSADVFVFAWKSSKHAAYDCVKAALPDKDVLVMAPGGYRFSDYPRLGAPLSVLVLVVAPLLIAAVWPLAQ